MFSVIAQPKRFLYNPRGKAWEDNSGYDVRKWQSLHAIYKLTLFQVILTLIMVVAALLFYNNNTAFSILLGGLIVIIPDLCFAWILFRYSGARSAKYIVNSFYKGEAMKFLLCILMFTIVFKYWTVTPLAFFLAFFIVQLSHWFAPWLVASKYNQTIK